MSNETLSRRDLLKGALVGIAAGTAASLVTNAAQAGAAPMLSESDPQAKSLGYVEDASKVDAKANPNFKPGQTCANCLQAPTAKAGDATVACNIFAGRQVAAGGWCKVWVKRP